MSGMRRSMLIASRMCTINVLAANTSLIDAEVMEGDSYSTQIVCDEGYSIYEIIIKMGGVDITSTAYDPTYNTISIPSVTDDVDIECYAMHTMPSDYVRVDGIKNPSNAYLDTEYAVNNNNKVSIKFFSARQSGTNVIASSKATGMSTTNGSGWWYNSSNGNLYTFYAKTSVYVGTLYDASTYECIADYYNGTHLRILNGANNRTDNISKSTWGSAYYFCLFSRNQGYDSSYTAGQIIYYFRIYDYSTTSYVRYYIPCLNDSGVAGFWDAARGVFQGSSNSTAFEAIYVQDGLIFQLDGINKGPNADAWTDLKGGLVFTKYGNVTSISKGWDFPSADKNNGFLCSGSTMTVNGVPITIEGCYMPKSQNAAAIMGFQSSKGLAFAQSSGRYTFRQAYNRYNFTVSINTGHTVSLNNDIGIDNYIELEKSTVDSWTVNIGTNEITIGRFKDGSGSWTYPLYGELYAIRLYNRSLTKEEIMRNQAIDNARFGLGLTFPQTT